MMWPNGAMSGILVAGTTSDPGSWSYQFSSPTQRLFLIPMVISMFWIPVTIEFRNGGRVQPLAQQYLAGSYATPLSMTLDRANSLVVVDTNNHRIVSYGVLCRKFALSVFD